MTPGVGAFGLVDNAGLLPAAIRLCTRSPWSHAFVVISGGRTVEAGAGGAFIGQLSDHDDARHLAFNTGETLTDVQRAAIELEALELVGTPYGFLDIAGLAVASWTGHAPGFIVRRVKAERALICSQLVARCYFLGAGMDLAGGRPDALVTPGDLGLRPSVQIVR